MNASRIVVLAALALIFPGSERLSTRAQSLQSSPQVTLAAQPVQSQIIFTVTDKDSHFVDALRIEDLRLLEDNKRQEISALRRLDEQSLSLAILIDTSVSQEATIPQQKAAAAAFLKAIMRPEKDHAAVATFTGELSIEQSFTDNLGLLDQAITRVKFVRPPGYVGRGMVVQGTPPTSGNAQVTAGSTAIWDAIWETTEQLPAPVAAENRKAIILLTDGIDTSSKRKMREVIERAVTANVVVYAIGIGAKDTYGIDENALRKISDQTGGRAFFPKKAQNLADVFAEIQQELRFQYELTYRSSGKANSSRKLELEIVNPALRAKDFRISYPRITTAK